MKKLEEREREEGRKEGRKEGRGKEMLISSTYAFP